MRSFNRFYTRQIGILNDGFLSSPFSLSEVWVMYELLAAAGGISLACLYLPLAERFPGKSVVEFAPLCLGPFLGRLVGLVYIWWWLHIGAIIFRQFGEFIITAILPTTPISVVMLVMLLACAYGVGHGVQVPARANQVLFAVVVGSLLIMMALVAPKVRLHNLMPFLGGGLGPVLRGSYAPLAWCGTAVNCLQLVMPSLPRPRQMRRPLQVGLGAAGLLLGLNACEEIYVIGHQDCGMPQPAPPEGCARPWADVRPGKRTAGTACEWVRSHTRREMKSRARGACMPDSPAAGA